MVDESSWLGVFHVSGSFVIWQKMGSRMLETKRDSRRDIEFTLGMKDSAQGSEIRWLVTLSDVGVGVVGFFIICIIQQHKIKIKATKQIKETTIALVFVSLQPMKNLAYVFKFSDDEIYDCVRVSRFRGNDSPPRVLLVQAINKRREITEK